MMAIICTSTRKNTRHARQIKTRAARKGARSREHVVLRLQPEQWKALPEVVVVGKVERATRVSA